MTLEFHARKIGIFVCEKLKSNYKQKFVLQMQNVDLLLGEWVGLSLP